MKTLKFAFEINWPLTWIQKKTKIETMVVEEGQDELHKRESSPKKSKQEKSSFYSIAVGIVLRYPPKNWL